MPTDYPAVPEQGASRVVMLSLHTSPLAQAGRGDAGGLNVYVNALSRALAAQGTSVDIVTTDLDGAELDGVDKDSVDADRMDFNGSPAVVGRQAHAARVFVRDLGDGRRVHVLRVRSECRQEKARLLDCLEDLAERALASLRSASAEPVRTVHSHYWLSGLAGIPLAAALGADLVHTMHTIGAVKRERDPSAAEDPRRHDAELRIASTADLLTANTVRESADLQRIFGVRADRIAMVQPGTDLKVFHPPPAPDARLAPRGSRPVRLTFAGRLQPHKGPQVAVAAVAALRRLLPEVPVTLTVAGRQSGGDAIDVRALAQQKGISEILVLTEPLPHPELADLFRVSDAVLVPSYSESFGLVALEAKACGTPVLAHNVGGLAELVDHGRSGILIDSLDPAVWAQHLAELIADRGMWAALSSRAAEIAGGFSWESTAEQAQAAYRSASAHVAGAPG